MMETGESNLNVIAVQASVHLPHDHNLLVQNLSSQVILGSLSVAYVVLHASSVKTPRSSFILPFPPKINKLD